MTGIFYSFIIAATVFSGAVKLTASDYFKKVSQTYATAKAISVQYTVKTYNRRLKKYNTVNCSYVSDGLNVYAKNGDKVVLRNNKYFITVSPQTKEIRINDALANKKGPFVFEAAKIDSMFANGKFTAVVDDKTGKEINITLSYKDQLMDKITFSIDPLNYLITKTVVSYNPLSKNDIKTSETTYTSIKLDEKPGKEIFDESRILEKKDNQLVAAKGYEGYKIVDYRKKNSK